MTPRAALAAALIAAALALPGVASGAAIDVTTNADAVASDGSCSLREAVTAANTDTATSDCPAGSGADQISLGATTYTLTAGELGVTSELTITGAGAASTTIDGNHNGRVLNVGAAGKLTLNAVGITGGLTSSGGTGANGFSHDPAVPGGGGDGGAGGDGGGIASAGTLTINACRVFDNTTGNGGLGGNGTGPDGNNIINTPNPGIGGQGGHGGNGGGVYSTGTLTIAGSTIDGNVTGHGGTGGEGTGGQGFGSFPSGGGSGGIGGPGGFGGGVYATGAPTITGSAISGNTTGPGGPAGNGHGAPGNSPSGDAGAGSGGTGGNGGSGGGIWFDTSLNAFDDTIGGNTTGGGNFGGIGFGGTAQAGSNSGKGTGGTGGKGGDGGGIGGGVNTSGKLDLERSLLDSNHTGSGGGGGSGSAAGATEKGGNGGAGGGGGGLYDSTSVASAVNVTLSRNATGAGGDKGTAFELHPDPSTFGNGGNGGNGSAARVHFGALNLLQTTISANTDGFGGAGATPGVQGTGSLHRDTGGATLTLGNSIAGGTCSGVTDGGGNLAVILGVGQCPGTPGNPKLGPLQDNGGPTKTMAIGTDGAAIDKLAPSPDGRCGADTDQRGATRPSLGMCDIGAYEVAPPIATTGDATAAGTLGGTLDARGLRTRWYFEYGTTSSYGSVTADQFSTGGSTPVSAALSGLTPDTTYHYRLVGVNPDGTSTGADRTFITPKLPPGGGPGGTTQRPVLSNLRLKPKKFRVSGKKAVGTKISYRDTRAAVTTFTVLKPLHGVKVKGKCVKPSKKRHGKRCTRYVPVGRFTHVDVAGANAFRWRGKVGGHKLKPGSYKLRAVPVAGQLAGKAVAATFRVVK